MKNKKLIRIISALLIICSTISIFSGCKKNIIVNETKPSQETTTPTTNIEGTEGTEGTQSTSPTATEPTDPSTEAPTETPTSTETEPTEETEPTVPKELVDYYLNFGYLPPNENSLVYTGSFMFDGVLYPTIKTYDKLSTTMPLLKEYANMELDKGYATIIPIEDAQRPTNLYIVNHTSSVIKYNKATVYGVALPIEKDTNLYDLIGEQVISAKPEKNFLDEAIEILGNPESAYQKNKENIEFVYYYGEKQIRLTIMYNLLTDTGYFKIEYEEYKFK